MIKIYKDDSANAIFIEDTNGVQFMNSLQAIIEEDACSILDLAREIEIVTQKDFSEFVDENENPYGNNVISVCNALNAIFQSSGTSSNELPTITSPLGISLTQGEILNYELTADYGVGYEWDLSNVPSVTTIEGNVRKLIGGSALTVGEYAIPVKAINYNGEDSQVIELSVGNPTFANTKSVNFNNNDFLGANAGILQNTLGRNSNGAGLTDSWTISLYFKAGTATNASQTIFYFGNQDVQNQGYMQLKYNGQNNQRRIEFIYGSNNNRLNFYTQTDSIVVGQWHHIMVSYDGGTTGSQSNEVDDYYDRFKFFIDGVNVSDSNIKTHQNYGYSGSIIGQNLRVGKYNNGQSMRNNCRIDELAIYNDDVSSLISNIYNGGSAVDLMSLSTEPQHWWRMGDGDSYPYLFDVGFQQNCIFIMNNMTSSDIVNDVP